MRTLMKVTAGLGVFPLVLSMGVASAVDGGAHTIILASTHGLILEGIPGDTTSLTCTVRIKRLGPNTYLQCYEANIGSDNEYFGVQSTPGHMTAIFSVFDFADPERVRAYGDAKTANAVDTLGDGTFVSVRAPVRRVSKYTLTIAKTADGWWTYTVNGRKVGAIQVGAGALQTQGAAWAEFWTNNYNPHPTPPPPVRATVTLAPEHPRG